jgi:hypothetical protein
MTLSRVFLLAIVVAQVSGCTSDAPGVAGAIASASPAPAAAPAPAPATRAVSHDDTLHIHLPGIGGYRNIDRGLLRGLREGGYDVKLKPFDWTGADAGLAALVATQRHREESTKLAQLIREHARRNPGGRITVTAHSGGTGIVTWALEQLPGSVQVDTVVFIAPALSPEYDLSRALARVRDKVYVFYSPYDAAVLGIGTKMLGTVDGVKAEASGKVGFTRPATAADERQYEKLVQVPYQSAWIKLGNIGDHIGGLSRPFSRAVLAPLLARGELPAPAPPAPADQTPARPPDPLTVPPPLPTASTAPAAAAAAPPAPATTPAPAAAGR